MRPKICIEQLYIIFSLFATISVPFKKNGGDFSPLCFREVPASFLHLFQNRFDRILFQKNAGADCADEQPCFEFSHLFHLPNLVCQKRRIIFCGFFPNFTKAAERFSFRRSLQELNELSSYFIFVLPDVFCSRRLRPLLLLPQARCNEFFEEADLRGFRLRPCF